MQSQSIITRTFLLTVSTKGDISGECVKSIVEWAKSSTVYAYVVTEMGANAKKHLHAALVFKDHVESKVIRQNVWARKVKPFHPDSIGKIAVVCQVMPGHKWYDEYLRKESGVVVELDTYERTGVEAYLPSPEVQDELIQKSKRRKTNDWWDEAVVTWTGSTFENTPSGAGCWLKSQMRAGFMQIITDDRKLTDMAYVLWEHRNDVVTLSAHQEMLLKRKEYDYTDMSGALYNHPVGNPGNSRRI